MINPREPDYENHPAHEGRPSFRYAPAAPFDEPLVTVLTPFYNADPGEFEQTARCVMGQSLQRLEWIIVNDASTDPASLEALARWRDADPRVRVIDLEVNSGPSAARNRGFREARCELVFQLDADDLIEATTLEKCVWHALTHENVGFINTWEVGFGAQGYLWRHGFHEPKRFLEQSIVGAHAVLVRRSIHERVGGYDESIRGGMEDWEFWLRCASHGIWGHTLPEFLTWYRRREDHSDRWENWDRGDRQRMFRDALRRRYADLVSGGMPGVPYRVHHQLARLPDAPPMENPLPKESRRVLMILPWMRMGGADKFNLDLLEQLTARGWEVSIATTIRNENTWQHAFARSTPDIFPLHAFCFHADHPLFLRYLIESRRPDVVLISNSDAGYLFLPYLKSVCPLPAYVDYNHMEEMYWRQGGHPRSGAGMADLLDLQITSSSHLRSWMIEHGSDPERIEVATTNIDPDAWTPDSERRRRVRERLGIDEDMPVILYAGRICDQKQPGVMARAINELATRAAFVGKDFRFLVAGDGELRAQFERDLDRFRLRRHVKMLGEVSNEEVNDLMCAADILFLPSRWEGIALVVYEAMAAGVVVVGADVGGQRELVTPECGYLLPKSEEGRELEEEPGPYAEALFELISNEEKRRSMAQAARRRVCESFTLDRMGDRMEHLLLRAIEHRLHKPRPPLPAGLALESATRAVDLLRIQNICNRLWMQSRQQTQQTRQQGGQLPRPSGSKRAPKKHPALAQKRERRARRELRRIERSRSWRLVQSLKHNPAYGLLARLRWGPNWRDHEQGGTPSERLARIHASRSYRLIQMAKRTPLYRLLRRPEAPPSPPSAQPEPPADPPIVRTMLNGSATGLNGHARPRERETVESR